MGVTRQVLNLGDRARSSGVLRVRVLVVRQKAFKSIVTVVLLLLDDADVVVDSLMDLVKFWRTHLRISPPDQQLELFMLQLGCTAHVKATKVFAHHRGI